MEVPVGSYELNFPFEKTFVETDIALGQISDRRHIGHEDIGAQTAQVDSQETHSAAQLEDEKVL